VFFKPRPPSSDTLAVMILWNYLARMNSLEWLCLPEAYGERENLIDGVEKSD
jgi:hypothetical protein